jgi:hypothetical protein
MLLVKMANLNFQHTAFGLDPRRITRRAYRLSDSAYAQVQVLPIAGNAKRK